MSGDQNQKQYYVKVSFAFGVDVVMETSTLRMTARPHGIRWTIAMPWRSRTTQLSHNST